MNVTIAIDPYSNVLGTFVSEAIAKDWLQRRLKGHRVIFDEPATPPYPDKKLKCVSFTSAYIAGDWICTLETYEVKER